MKIAIVGSGVVGASAAYFARKAGATVVVVDASYPGQATGASAGIVCPWPTRSAVPARYNLTRRGAQEYAAFVQELAETEIGYEVIGALALVDTAEEQRALVTLLEERRHESPEIGDVQAVEGPEAMRLFPALAADRLGVYIGGAARADGRRLRAAILRAAARSGIETTVGRARLTRRVSSAAVVEVNSQIIEADQIIIAAGAWSPALLRILGCECPVEPQRGQIVQLRMEGTDISAWPVVLPAPPSDMSYIVPFAGSRIAVGATREDGSGFDCRVTAGGMLAVLSETLGMAPGLASATHIETRVGFRPMSRDGLPLLGPVEGLSNVVVATGVGEYGLTASLLGKLAVQVALGKATDVDIAPYDPNRLFASHS